MHIASIADRIDSIADKYLTSEKVLGFSIAVLQNRDTLFAKGFGFSDYENKKPVTKETIFPMASVTKLITSVAVMKLIEQEKLSLDNSLLEIMPDFPNTEQAAKIKVKHLLNHTSGLADYAEYGDSLFVKKNIIMEKQHFFQFLMNKQLLFEPGTSFSYSNSGFVLVMLLIEQLSGQLYEDFIEENISKPLSLPSLKHSSRNRKDGSLTKIYNLADSTFMQSMMDTVTYIKGDGGLSATALDLAGLPYGLLDEKVISKHSLNEMMMSFEFPDGAYSDYGLGARKGVFEGHRFWGHTGGHIGYWCSLAYFPAERISIAVFVNTDLTPADALQIEGEVALAVFNLKPPILENIEQKNGDLSKYIGNYEKPEEAYMNDPIMLIVQYDDDKTYLYRKRKNINSKGEKLYYLGDKMFAPENYPMDRLVFDMDDRENVIAFRDYYNGFFIQVRKKIDTAGN